MKTSKTLFFVSFIGICCTPASAFWRTACSVVQTARIDPILDPGSISGHVHKLAGASNVNMYSDYDSLQTTNCSSCEVQADHSAYWTPQLYYAHSNGTFQDVPNEGMTVYYVGMTYPLEQNFTKVDSVLQGRGGNASTTQPFPQGFKMLTGNSLLRSYDNETLTYLNTRPVADRVSFHCIDENNDIPEQHYMFDTNCVNGMRAQVNFQSCWDGVNLYLPGNAHVDYLSGIDYGVCPPTHPVSIPGLFFEVLYWTNNIDQSAGGQFVFAQGDTTGYGFHGDFLNGWDMTVQTAAVQNCLYQDATGVVSACSDLAPTDDINFARDCLPQPPLNDEPVLGLLSQLPGCNPITSGPDPAPQVICGLNSNVPITNSSTTTAVSTSTVTTSSSSFSNSFTTSATPVAASSDTSSGGGVFVQISADSTIGTTSATLTDSTVGTFVTTLITVTQPVTDNITSTTDITIAPSFGTAVPTYTTCHTTFVRARRRQSPRTRLY